MHSNSRMLHFTPPGTSGTLLLLVRTSLSLFVAFTALSVYFYFKHVVLFEALYLFGGVFLLAAAASALNQVQERQGDALMNRTIHRPLPSGRLQPWQAVMCAICAFIAGISLLYWGTTAVAATIGAVTLLGYNAIYTPVKKISPFALLIGAVVGALPVIVGCAAATGTIGEKSIVIAFFVFFWQVPHFLLLLLRYADDYARAGIATLLTHLSNDKLRKLAGVWILATIGVSTLFPLFGIIQSVPLVTVLIVVNVLMIVSIIHQFHSAGGLSSVSALYVYQGVIFTILMVQGFI